MVKRLLSDTTPGGRRRRSRIGLFVAVLMLPALLGAMGCFGLTAPIGNPERSRVDPALTGIWATDFYPKGNGDAWIWILETYDRRGWLVSWLSLETTYWANPSRLETSDETIPIQEMLRADYLELSEITINKAWLTEISGHRFLIFEPRLQIGENPPMQTQFWWTMRIDMENRNRMKLEFINLEFDGFEQAMDKFSDSISQEQLGKLFERVIRKNIDDPELFMEEGETPGYFQRIAIEDYRHVKRILRRANVSTEVKL